MNAEISSNGQNGESEFDSIDNELSLDADTGVAEMSIPNESETNEKIDETEMLEFEAAGSEENDDRKLTESEIFSLLEDDKLESESVNEVEDIEMQDDASLNNDDKFDVSMNDEDDMDKSKMPELVGGMEKHNIRPDDEAVIVEDPLDEVEESPPPEGGMEKHDVRADDEAVVVCLEENEIENSVGKSDSPTRDEVIEKNGPQNGIETVATENGDAKNEVAGTNEPSTTEESALEEVKPVKKELDEPMSPEMFKVLDPARFLKGEFEKNRLFGRKSDFSCPRDRNRQWMRRNFCSPAEHHALFFHHQIAKMEICRAIFYTGMSVALRKDAKRKERKYYRVRGVASPLLILSTDDDDNFIQVNCWEVYFVKLTRDEEDEEENVWTRYVNKLTANKIIFQFMTEEIYKRPLCEFVLEGCALEVINRYNPQLVDTGIVEKNQCGLLTLAFNDATTEVVHMASPRIKPYGWFRYQTGDSFQESKRYVYDQRLKAVLPFVFDLDPFENFNSELSVFTQPFGFYPHKFIENNLVAVLDQVTRFKYFPGVVTHVYNEYFVRVSIVTSVKEPLSEMITINCSHACPMIIPFVPFPRGGVSLPEGMESNDQLSCEGLSNALGRQLTVAPASRFVSLVQDGEKLSPFYDEDDENVDVPPPKKCLPRTMVEVIENGRYAVTGRILRVTKQFMVISLEDESAFRCPKLYSFVDMNVFPVGFAEEAKLLKSPSVFSLMPSLPLNKLEDEYTSQIGSKDKPFMSALNLNILQWCPLIFINKNCFVGPFINKSSLWRLSDSYGPGSLEGVLKQLMNDLTTCCLTHKIAHLLEVKRSDDFPSMIFKHYDNDANERKHSSNRTVYTTMACHSVLELPQYLNLMCRLIDACPGFIQTGERKTDCVYGCSRVNDELRYMLPENHIHTSFAVHHAELEKLRGPRKRKTIVEQLQESKGPSISPKKRKLSISEEEEDDNDDDDDEAIEEEELKPVSRCSYSIDGKRPPIVRPVQQIDNDSDSVITVSSDDSEDDEPAPELISQINPITRTELFTPFPASNPVLMPILHRQPRPTLPKLTPINNGTQFRRNIVSTGPRVRLANPARPPPPVMCEQNPILDPVRRPIPRLTPVHRQPTLKAPGGDCRFVYDPITGKHVVQMVQSRPPIIPMPILNARVTPPSQPAASIVTPPMLVAQPPKRISFENSDSANKVNLPPISSNPRKWKTAQVCAFLTKARLEDPIIDVLKDNRMEGEEFLLMNSEKFQQLGLKLGPSVRLENLAQKVKQLADAQYPEDE